MRRKRIGSFDASAFCLGTANWGAKGNDAARAVFDAYRAAGGNFFDCAHIYACWRDQLGLPERLLGEFIRGEDRTQLVIATKGGHPDFKGYPKPDAYLSAQTIRSDIDESRERLGVGQIDLFYLHRDDPRMSVGEIMDILFEEVRRGSIKYVGASNWSIDRIQHANEYARTHGKAEFVISQPMWNLGHLSQRGGDASMASLNDRGDDIAWHEKTGMPVACYTPTAQGYFADNGRLPKRYDNPISRARLERCRELAQRIGKSSGQLALAWLMNQSFSVYPILGTQDLHHLNDSLGSAEIELDSEARDWLANG